MLVLRQSARPCWRPAALVAALVLLAAVPAVACSATTLDEIEPVRASEVELQGNRFSPRVIEVAPGTTVTWTWQGGSVLHDVKGDGFDSGLQSSGTFRHTFSTPGTYDYECTLHNNMTGRVIVAE